MKKNEGKNILFRSILTTTQYLSWLFFRFLEEYNGYHLKNYKIKKSEISPKNFDTFLRSRKPCFYCFLDIFLILFPSCFAKPQKRKKSEFFPLKAFLAFFRAKKIMLLQYPRNQISGSETLKNLNSKNALHLAQRALNQKL